MSDSFYSVQVQDGLRFTDDFLQLFCEKNSDGTKKLRLKGNELQQRFKDRLLPADIVSVSYFLRNHPEINELDVSFNSIEDEGLEHLCHVILKHKNNLEHLNLAHCDIGTAGIRTLYFAAREGNSRLKSLRLAGNKIGSEGGHLTALIVPFMPSLEYLDVGDTEQTVYSIDAMFLHIYRSSLKVIDVSRPVPQTLTSEIDNTFLARSFSEIIRLMTTLVELHAQKCDLDGHDIETMIDGLSFNKSLKFLDIGYNNICCVGAEFLCGWLRTRPELLGLNIAGNKITNHGARALSVSLPFSKLRYLDISQNKIGDEGMMAILNSIKKPYMLRYFFLWGNMLTHPVNKIIHRMLLSKVFDQERIDVQVYCVDGVFHAAYCRTDRYKHRYYGVMDHGCATELKIKRNRIETPNDKPRALVDFKYIDRYPPVETRPNKESYPSEVVTK